VPRNSRTHKDGPLLEFVCTNHLVSMLSTTATSGLFAAVLVSSILGSACSTPVFNVKSYGAIGDGKTDDTLAIRKASIALKANKGGTLYFPAGGTYLTGSMNLTSNTDFFVEKGATVLGTMHGDDWPLLSAMEIWPQFGHGSDCTPGTEPCRLMHQAFLFSWNTENITFRGKGTVDGNANHNTWWKCAKNLQLPPCNGYSRPHLMMMSSVQTVSIKDLTFQNSPDWTLHFPSTRGLHISNIVVKNPEDSPNTDGIDLDCTQGAVIENSFFSVGDDAIAIKSGIDYFGRLYNKPSRDIIYRNNVIEAGHGISIGSETSGGIYNVTFENIQMKNTDRGPRIKSCRGRGGTVQDIVYRNITGQDVQTAVSIDLDYVKSAKPTNKSATPTVQNILLENVLFSQGTTNYGEFKGLQESPLINITLKNVITKDGQGNFGACRFVQAGVCTGDQMRESDCPPCFKFEKS
jgi:polygalacturonase